MSEAFICEGTRTPIGRFGGSLSSIRTDDLASLPLIALKENSVQIYIRINFGWNLKIDSST